MKYFTEVKAVVDISHDADILMSHLQEVGGHLVQQGVAKVIHPIYIKSKYRINPTAQIRSLSEPREMSTLSLAFRDFVDSRIGSFSGFWKIQLNLNNPNKVSYR